MPSVTLPNGVIVRNVPAGVGKQELKRKVIASGLATEADFAPKTQLTDEELIAKYNLGTTTEQPPPESGIFSGIGRGTEQLLSSFGTSAGALFGDEEEAALAGLERGRKLSEKYGEGASLKNVTQAYGEDGLGSAIATALGQTPEAVSEQIPQLALTAALAKAGALTGALPFLSVPTGGLSVPIGGGLGALASFLPQLFSSNVERQAAEQQAAGAPIDVDVGKAGGAALLQAVPEVAASYITFGKPLVKSILGIADDAGLDGAAARNLTGLALAKLQGKAGASLAGNVARGAGRGALIEMPTEVAQQVVERAQAGLDVLSDDALAEYGEAAYLAGTVGGVFGGTAGLTTRAQARQRLQEVKEQETQDLFTAERARQGENKIPLGIQPDLAGIPPVMSPQTRAGEAQGDIAREQALEGERYRTRGGEERFAPSGTFSPTALPDVLNDNDKVDAFTFMRQNKLTQAAVPENMKAEEKAVFEVVLRKMNEKALMGIAAAEVPRLPGAPGETPITLDPTKQIKDLTPEERVVFDRAVGAVRARMQEGTMGEGKGQQRLPKALTNILVGEESAAAKAEEAKKAQDAADKEAKKAQDAADKLNVQRAKASQDPRRQQAFELVEPTDQKGLYRTRGGEERVAPVDAFADTEARSIPEDTGVPATDEQIDLFAPSVAPTTQQAAPPARSSVLPSTTAEIAALFPGASKQLKIFKENEGLAGKDLSDPAVAAEVKDYLEKMSDPYTKANRKAVDAFLARPEFQVTPIKPEAVDKSAVVDELGGDAIDTTTQRVEETPKDVQATPETRGSSVDMFAEEAISDANNQNDKSREKLIEMPIDQFLALADKGMDATKTKKVSSLVEQGTPFNTVPQLDITEKGRVRGHEGRHRAMALKALGYTTMPVRLISDNIRWGQQNNPESFDYEKNLPSTIQAQKGAVDPNYRVAFPITREQIAPTKSKVETKPAKVEPKSKVETTPKVEPKPAKVKPKPAENKKEVFANLAAKYKDFNEKTAFTRTEIYTLADDAAANPTAPAVLAAKAHFNNLAKKEEKNIFLNSYLEAKAAQKNLYSLENAANSPALEGELLAAVQTGNLKQTLSLLADKIGNRPEVARILRTVQSLNLKTKIVVGPVPGNEQKAGAYNPVTDTVYLDPEIGLNEHTLIHELSHAALANQIANPESKIAKKFIKFSETASTYVPGSYGATDAQEFAAELMGNSEFASALNAIQTPKKDTLLERIIQALAEFFGFRKNTTLYDEGIRYINEMLNLPRKVEPSLEDMLFLGTPTSAAQALKNIGITPFPEKDEALTGISGEIQKITESGLGGKAYEIVLRGAFSVMRLQNIYSIFKDAGPKYTTLTRAIKALSDAVERRLGEVERRSSMYNDKYQKWVKVSKKYAAAMSRMAKLAFEARRAGIDFIPENNFKPTKAQQEDYDRLSNVLNNLPAPIRDMYLDMRRDYDAEFNQRRDFLLQKYRDNPTAFAEMKLRFEKEHPRAGYIPFMRFGDFVLEYTDPQTDRRTVMQFESAVDRREFTKKLGLPEKDYQWYTRMDQANYDSKKVPSTSFLGKVMSDLKASDASQQQLNSVYQAYLSMFPTESLAKRMMQSDDVAGSSEDLLRAYAITMIQWVKQSANSKYSPLIDEALDTIVSQRDVKDTLTTALAKTLGSTESREFLHNPTFNTATSIATGVSFGVYILGNVSSAIVNLTALPIGYAELGARFGFGEAALQLASSTKMITPLALKDMSGDTAAWATVPPKYKRLIDTLLDFGQLQHTQTREILEGRKISGGDPNMLAKFSVSVLDYGARPFNAAEKINRGAIAIAAYELAKKGGNGVSPMTESAAIQFAVDTVKNVNTSGTAATGPRLFQSSLGRLFGTFKGFALNQTFIVAKALYQSLPKKGGDPEVRRIAIRQVIATYLVTGALSGVAGMPFLMGTVTFFNSVLMGLIGDDDDDYEYLTSKELMRDVVGDIMYKGWFNYYTNIALADRTSITGNLFFKDDPKLIEDVGYLRAMLIQSLGPAVAYGVRLEDAATYAKEGDWPRAFETGLPIAAANLFKAARFYTDGADINKDGEVVDSDISVWAAVMQAVGFAPADRAMVYEERSLAMGVQTKAIEYQQQLLDLAWAAHSSGDEETVQEVRAKLDKLANRYPEMFRNSGRQTLIRSFKSRNTNMRDNVSGLSLRMPKEQRRRFESLGD